MILFRILAAALASLILGFLWYHPRAFGTIWMRLVNLSPEMVERGRRRAPLFMLFAFLSGVLIASASQMILHAAGVSSLSGAMLFPLIVWIGFVAPTAFLETVWEERPLMLFFINSSYWLATLVSVSLILYI